MLAMIKREAARNRLKYAETQTAYKDDKVFELIFYYQTGDKKMYKCLNEPFISLYFCEDELIIVNKEYLKDYGVF